MHPDLALIIDLWDVDRATDLAQARARELKQLVGAAEAQIEAVAKSQEALKVQQAAMTEKEAELQKLLDRYVIRRDRSKELLKGGSALDFVTVQKQLEQCTMKVDELEEQMMDCMVEQEALCSQEAALSADAQAAEDDHQAARQTWIDEGRMLRVELEELGELRAQRWADFPRDLQGQYTDLRRRGRDVVAEIRDGNCSACQMTVNPQAAVDIRAGRRVHSCRGCNRYLTLPVDAEEAEA